MRADWAGRARTAPNATRAPARSMRDTDDTEAGHGNPRVSIVDCSKASTRMRLASPLAAALALMSTAVATQAPQPTSIDPLREQYQAAQTFQLAGDLERAETVYAREVIPRALRRLAALASAEGRQDDARQYLEEARGHQPDDPLVTLDLVVVLLRAGDSQTARQLAREVSSADPSNARALRLYGKALLIAGENAEARSVLERSMRQATEFDTGLSLAYANLRTKRLTEARALFDEMMAGNSSAEIRSLIARAYLENGLVDPAASYLEQALRLNADHQPSRRLLDDLKAGRPFNRGLASDGDPSGAARA